MASVNFSIDDIYHSLVDVDKLENTVTQTLKQQSKHEENILSIVITDDVHMRQLNKEFRDTNSTTDVLSFSSGEIDPDTGFTNLGDIIISYPQAVHQSKQGGHSVKDELILLTVHGILHLLGFDHADPHQKTEMWDAQSKILQLLGCQISPP